jgi:hypothetical protein
MHRLLLDVHTPPDSALTLDTDGCFALSVMLANLAAEPPHP